MRILIETIPAGAQRYDTVGDWLVEEDGTWHIRVSELPSQHTRLPEKFALLVAFHELVEMSLCIADGVTQTDVDHFDLQWQSPHPERIHEPGDDPAAPYFRQHQIANAMERFLASQLRVNWEEYELAIASL